MILNVQEIPDTRYFDATGDKLYSAALKLLTERWEEGYWYEEPEKPENPNIDLNKIPDCLRTQAENELERYEREDRYYKVELRSYKSIEKAVGDKDGKLAWNCLQARSGGEYESVELEDLE